MARVVVIGGGTGTFTVLSALRDVPDIALTAVVAETDDGGSTGHLRDAYGFLPAGDARQALVALAEEGNVLRDLFAYRFTKSDVAGHNLGNLFLTALTDLLGSDTAALAEASRILRVRGLVVPAAETPGTLVAKLSDGTVITGESALEARRSPARVAEVALANPVPATAGALAALQEADLIILGPGSLYTSTVAALLPEGMRAAVADARAKLVYIGNLFTTAGETPGYTHADHVREVARYAGRAPDVVFVNNAAVGKDVLEWYAKEEEFPVADDLPRGDLSIHRLPLASVSIVPPVPGDPLRRSLLRHDPVRLREALSRLID